MHNFLCIVYVQNNMPFFARLIPRLDSIPVFKDCYINTFRVFIFRSPTNIKGDFFYLSRWSTRFSFRPSKHLWSSLLEQKNRQTKSKSTIYFFSSRVGSIINKNERQITQL